MIVNSIIVYPIGRESLGGARPLGSDHHERTREIGEDPSANSA